MLLIALLFLLVFALLVFYFRLYNSLIRGKNEAENGWSQIDVQLKRRHDLIPNLVASVKGYMDHERETLERVIAARARAMEARSSGERAAAEGELSGLLSRLLVVSENYPQLKADRNVADLMEELRTTENGIAFARQHYNDTVMALNYKIEAFPWKMLAPGMGLVKRAPFELKEMEQREAPKVTL